PVAIENYQQNLTEEIRLQSSDPDARVEWTAGAFFSWNRQDRDEQIHDPQLSQLSLAYFGAPYTDIFTDPDGNPVLYDPRFPDASYFLVIKSKDQQQAIFGEATALLGAGLKLTLGARYSWTK